MRFPKSGWKAMSLAAAMLVLAACETPQEDTASTGGQGASQQTTTATTTQPQQPVATQPSGPRPGSQEDLVLNVGDRIYFDFDKFELKPEARATIERWAGWLKQYPSVTVTLEGHCDERGTREYNLALGERRASSARNYLIALGVSPDRLGTISYGKERPVCTSSTEGCWAENRRSVMVVN